jgi:hypothetical protein
VAEGYNKTFALVHEKKEPIKKVAMLLEHEKTISGKKVYETIGIPEKKYDFELEE